MIQINVALPNGHAELLALLPFATVQDVRTEAQQAFGKKHLRLITAKNRVFVNFEQILEEAEIEDGERLTALVLQPQLAPVRVRSHVLDYGQVQRPDQVLTRSLNLPIVENVAPYPDRIRHKCRCETSGTSTTTGSNKYGLCLVVSWR